MVSTVNKDRIKSRCILTFTLGVVWYSKKCAPAVVKDRMTYFLGWLDSPIIPLIRPFKKDKRLIDRYNLVH